MSMDRYEEALELAKAGKPMDEVFPELKESEDERIRNELIAFLRAQVLVPTNQVYRLNGWITWLEKQKEQKPGDKDRYMEGYINGMNDTLKELKEQPKLMGAYEELKQPVWRKIKKGDYLPCRAYLWKLGFEDKKNFHGDCFVDGYLVPNEAVGVGCDTWYLPVDAIKNLPKEK